MKECLIVHDLSSSGLCYAGELYTRTCHCALVAEGSVWDSWPCVDLSIFKMDWNEGFVRGWWWQDAGQDVAEYAVMLAVILTIAIGTIRLIGSHAGNVFASVGRAIQ